MSAGVPEAAAVFGLVTGSISLVKLAYEIISSAKGRAPSWAEIMKAQLPNVQMLLEDAQKTKQEHDPVWLQVRDTIARTESSCQVLKKTIEEVCPDDETGKRQRVWIATKAILRNKKEDAQSNLMEIYQSLDVLKGHLIVTNTKMLEELKVALDSLQDDSGDEGSYHAARDQYINRSSGNMITHSGNYGKSFHVNTIDSVFLNLNGPAHHNVAIGMDEKLDHRALLDWLYYSEMRDRRDMIKEAHRRTFRWIFQSNRNAYERSPGVEPRLTTGFVPWLRNGDGLYWIHGKPGAGKSTMMKFLADDERLLQYGGVWARYASRDLVVASFYFHKSTASSALQQSLCGLYRALLWQLMQQEPSLAKCAFPQWQSNFASAEPRLAQLAEALRRLAKASNVAKRFIFLIDGLDEYEHDDTLRQNELAKDLRKLVETGFIKMIIASRPETAFRSHFSQYPNLALHELTAPDIQHFVEDELERSDCIRPLGEALSFSESRELQELVQTVVSKAEGVFLWARVAVDFAVARIQQHAPLSMLATDVFNLNSDLEMLYGQILARIKRFDKSELNEGLTYLRLTMQWMKCFNRPFKYQNNPLTLSILGVAREMHGERLSKRKLLDLVERRERSAVTELTQYKRRIEARVKICCLGLLEVQIQPHDSSARDENVRPMHRTLTEYLEANKASLEQSGDHHHLGRENYDYNVALMSGLLATTYDPVKPHYLAMSFFRMNTQAEKSSGSAQTLLLSAFGQSMSANWSAVWQDRFDRPPNIFLSIADQFEEHFGVEPQWEDHIIQNPDAYLPWVRVADPRLPDLLALSIRHGGWRYLDSYTADLQKIHGTVVTSQFPMEYWSHLMVYGLFDEDGYLSLEPNNEAIQVLLSSGACPNTPSSGLTVWQLLLDAMLIESNPGCMLSVGPPGYGRPDLYDIMDSLVEHGANIDAHRTYGRFSRYRKSKAGKQVEHVLVELRRVSPHQVLHRQIARTHCSGGRQQAIDCRCDWCLPFFNRVEPLLQRLQGTCDPPCSKIEWSEVVRAMLLVYRQERKTLRDGREHSPVVFLPNNTPPKDNQTTECKWGSYRWIPVDSNSALELFEELEDLEFDHAPLELSEMETSLGPHHDLWDLDPPEYGIPTRMDREAHGIYTIAGWLDLEISSDVKPRQWPKSSERGWDQFRDPPKPVWKLWQAV